MSKYRIRMNGKVYEMEIEIVDEDDEKERRPHFVSNVLYKNTDSTEQVVTPGVENQPHFDDILVKSPMPGLITKLMVKEGDVVGKDEPVLVLEAMKMENEICAPYRGTIKEIFASEGDTISGNIPLFELEPEDTKLA